MGRLRVGDPLDKNTDVGAINSAEQLAAHRGARRRGGAGGRVSAARSRARCPSAATGSPRRCSPTSRPPTASPCEEIFGPVVSVLSFRTQAEAIEKANNSRYGLAAGIWTDKGAKAFEVAGALRAGVVWQNTYNHFDPTAAFGGYKESGFGREGGPAGLRPYLQVTAMSAQRLAVRKTYKLWIGGAFVRSESGRYDPAATDGSASPTVNIPRASRKDVRDAVAAARKAAGPWAARTAYNRGQILYRAAEALESRGGRVRGPRRGRRGGRRARALRRLDRQARARARRGQPGGGAVPVLLGPRADRRRGRRGAPTSPRCSAWSPSSRPRSPPATRSWPSSRRASRFPGSTWPRCSGCPTSPRAWSTCSPGAARSSPRRSARTATSTRSSTPAVTRELAADLDRLAAETIKRVRHAAAATSYEARRRRRAERLEAVTELKTAWHPVGA